jgi:hypothetical protein
LLTAPLSAFNFGGTFREAKKQNSAAARASKQIPSEMMKVASGRDGGTRTRNLQHPMLVR